MDIDTSAFERTAKAYLKTVEDQLYKDLVGAGQEIRNESVRATPVDTGALRAGWQVRQSRTQYTAEVEIFNKVPYAGYVEYGTRYQRSQPMLRPAVNKILPRLIAKIRRYGK
jgi:HK97 gp10 family phage protein